MKYLILCVALVLTSCGTSQDEENALVEKQAQEEIDNGF